MGNVYLQRSAPFIFRRFTRLPFLPNGLHEHAEIILVRKGQIQMHVNDDIFALSEGDMLLLPPFTYHQFEENLSEDLLFDALLFTAKTCPELQNIFTTRMPATPVAKREKISRLAFLLFDRITEMTLGTQERTESMERRFSIGESGALNVYISALVHELTPATGLCDSEPQNLTTLKNVLVYCTEHYLENLSRDDVAEACGINPNTVSDVFSRIGTSFRDYLNSHRISYAYSLLRNTDLPISEVMQRSGYLNQGTFNQNFVQRFQKTPREIRNSQKEAL